MKKRVPSASVDWVAVQRAYEQSTETIKQICARFEITKGQLEHRQKNGKWLGRRSTLSSRQSDAFGRLFAVLEKQTVKLANAGGQTLGDKETQQLSELIKNFEKMTQISSAESKVDAPPRRHDIKDLRAKLAKRIDQFNRR